MNEHIHQFDFREICDLCFRERTEIEDEVDVGASLQLSRAATRVCGLKNQVDSFHHQQQELIRACDNRDAAERHVNKLTAANAHLEEKLKRAQRYRAACGCGEYMDEHQNVFENGHSPVAMAEDDCRRQSGDLESVIRERDKLAAEVIRLRAGNGPRVVVDYDE